MSNTNPSLFESAGGEPALRAVITDFYDRVFGDIMIGFLFVKADKRRLIDMEVEFAAKMLGSDGYYSGRSIREAHAKHPILGGHFMRRRKLLADAIDRHGLPDEVRTAWLEHTDALRDHVTGDSGGDCDPEAAKRRVDSADG